MKRLVAVALSALLAGFVALGVVPGVSAPAAAIEPAPAPPQWYERVWDATGAPGDWAVGLYNWVADVGAAPGLKPGPDRSHDGILQDSEWVSCDASVEPDPPCIRPVMGLVTTKPAGGVVTVAPEVQGVVNAVKGTQLTFPGLNVGWGGTQETQMQVDAAETDLEVAQGYVSTGWLNDDYEANSVAFAITAAPAYLSMGQGSAVLGLTQHLIPAGPTTLTSTQVQAAWPNGFDAFSLSLVYADGTTSGTSTSGRSLFRNNGVISETVSQSLVASPTKVFSHIRVGGQQAPDYAYWYPPGHPLRPPDVPGGLIGTLESSYMCRKSDGTLDGHVTDLPVTGAATGVTDVDIPAFNCDSDELLMSALVEWVTDTGRQTIYDYEADQGIVNTPAEWQDCGTKNCELKLYKVTGSGTEYCGQYAVGCPDWWESDAAGYQCKYGQHVVDLYYCGVFRIPGEANPTAVVTVGTDGSIDTKIPPAEDPKKFITDIPPQPKPTPVPDPTPPAPEPGTGDPLPTPTKCFPSGWGVFNPLEWVYRPVTCALTWAFVPSRPPSTQPILDALDTTVVGDVKTGIDDVGDAWAAGVADTSTGCSELLSVSLDVFNGEPLTVTSCQPLIAALAPIVRVLLIVAFAVVALMGAAKMILGALDVGWLEEKKE